MHSELNEPANPADLFSVMNASRNKLLIVLSILLSVGVGVGCNERSLEEICKDQVPLFQATMESSFTRLDQYVLPASEEGRMLASTQKIGEREVEVEWLDVQESLVWSKWSADRLKVVQDFMLAIEPRSDLRELYPMLNDIANDLVSFRGYAETGNAVRMHELLSHALTTSRQVQELTCGKNQI